MYLMYVDESGDVGTNNSPTKYFVLSAIIIHESVWQNILDDLVIFRRSLMNNFQLRIREEIHASAFINGSPNLKASISRNNKLEILKLCLKWLNSRNDLSIISVRCKKRPSMDVFDFTWRCLIQRFDNTLSYKNFPNGNSQDKGIIISDNTDGGKLTKLIREMRRYNNVPNATYYGTGTRQMRLRAVVEDPIFRDSVDSYFH